jgi:hypothetical protein
LQALHRSRAGPSSLPPNGAERIKGPRQSQADHQEHFEVDQRSIPSSFGLGAPATQRVLILINDRQFLLKSSGCAVFPAQTVVLMAPVLLFETET